MEPMLPYLQDLSEDMKWKELVSRWVRFEEKEPIIGVSNINVVTQVVST